MQALRLIAFSCCLLSLVLAQADQKPLQRGNGTCDEAASLIQADEDKAEGNRLFEAFESKMLELKGSMLTDGPEHGTEFWKSFMSDKDNEETELFSAVKRWTEHPEEYVNHKFNKIVEAARLVGNMTEGVQTAVSAAKKDLMTDLTKVAKRPELSAKAKKALEDAQKKMAILKGTLGGIATNIGTLAKDSTDLIREIAGAATDLKGKASPMNAHEPALLGHQKHLS